ncbi:hypothetical protein [Pyxidicoccus sp. MSG2]|uniref:T4 family baseplate hub assembly chaperone n=1 Tax=Pyxidicoccus sp. MSG2 TaxID=2996790 RepID=UPI002270C336|nr:hypothetical protein [Pyxidicoccus sp. MSG2]MCY1019290.1 hypothetical protein [Pyxidicoccus sp. MSG2]
MSSGVLCTLPGGWLDRRGGCQREVVLRPLRGGDEEWLYSLPPQTSQVSVLTMLLARCVKRIGPYRASRAMIRTLSMGDCDFLVLRLHGLTFGERVERVLVCPDAACGAKMDLDFELGQVPVEERPRRPRYTLRLEGSPAREVGFRLPGLGDVEAASRAEDPERALLARCVLDLDGKATPGGDAVDALPDAAREALDAAMEQASPRVEDTLEARCPECGREFPTTFDATASFLASLYSQRHEFDRAVHLLSFHYHWPLGEILGLTRERRRHYVRLLRDALDVGSGLSARERAEAS